MYFYKINTTALCKSCFLHGLCAIWDNWIMRVLFRFLALVALSIGVPTMALGVTAPRLVGVGHDAQWSPDEKYISYLRNDTLYASPLDELTFPHSLVQS